MRDPSIRLTELARIIAALPEAPVREVVANHFAQELNRRHASFSPSRWSNATGGKLTGPTTLAPPQ